MTIRDKEIITVRIGRNGESFYGKAVVSEWNLANTFFCTKKDAVINTKPHTAEEANSSYRMRVLDDATRGFQEVVALDFIPNNMSIYTLAEWAVQIARQLLQAGNPADAAQQLEAWMRGLGRIQYHDQEALLGACMEAIAEIRGPIWAF